jgi:hypothetical protein
MMGYSVTEAASVLGVPTERVWELLARGVLSGEPEGETGMRVFLQPRPAPAPAAPTDDPNSARSAAPERELSPFRELLTEFRSLTERYGQALLALGESRGEVASLRSRVDLLEARIDLRLPMTAPAAAPPPAQSLPVGETAPGASAETSPEHEDGDVHRPRRRGARRATESFAQALARAEDPSLADLAGATDADALAAFRSEHAVAEADATEADRGLPREVHPAEPMLVDEEAEEVEPAMLEPALGSEEPEAVDARAEPVDALAAPADIGPEPVDVEPEPAEPEPVALESVAIEPASPEDREPPAPEPATFEPEPAEPEPAAPEPATFEPEPAEPEPVALEPVAVEPTTFEPAAPEDQEPVPSSEAVGEALIATLPVTEPTPWPEFEVADEAIDVSEPVPSVAEPEPGAPPVETMAVAAETPGDAADVGAPADEHDLGVQGTADQQDAEVPITAADDDAEVEAPADGDVASQPEDEAGGEPADFDAERYTTVIEQPDWLEAEADDPWASGVRGGEATADIEDSPAADVPTVAEAEAPAEITAQAPDTNDPAPEEPAATDNVEGSAPAQPESGADEMEIPGGGQGDAPAEQEAEAAFPGSRELDEALDAFGDFGPRSSSTTADEEWPPVAGGEQRTTPAARRPSGYAAGPPRQLYGSSVTSGPATRAYRRLRRIFPT